MRETPPTYALQFLRWFCREDFIDEIEGDLTELFSKQVQHTPFRAKWVFIYSVMHYLRPEYMKLFHQHHPASSLFTMAMLGNYFTFAVRNLRKRTAFSLINILGLALGICACLIILTYIAFETSYDKFHQKASSLYRINRTFIENGERMRSNIWTTYGLGPALATDLPQVNRYIRTHEEMGVLRYTTASGEAKAFYETHILLVDTMFFGAFTFKPVRGTLLTCLKEPNSIVLTHSIAQKYFGTQDPIGRRMDLSLGHLKGVYTVSAVMEDVPQNSHFTFEILLPINNLLLSNQYKQDDGWKWNNFITYIQLNEDTPAALAEQSLPEFSKRRLDPKWKEHNGRIALHLQPLREIHLNPGLSGDGETVSRNQIYFFGLIATFILFIAWINYINLSTTRAMERAREVGIRKAIGAFRSQIILQFLFESVVINFMAIVLALGLTILLLPLLSDMMGKHLSLDIGDGRVWIMLAGLFLAGTSVSGIYPAIVMSSFYVAHVLKGQNRKGKAYFLRQTLVVFQFAASLILLSGTFVVYRQLHFMQAQDKGLQMDQMLIVQGPNTMEWNIAKQKLMLFKEQANKIVGVKSVTTSGAVPGEGHNWAADVRKSGSRLSEMKVGSVVWIDPDFISSYHIQLIAGRNFNAGIGSDMKSVIINEAALHAFDLGTAQQALQQQLIVGEDTTHIIGVLKNYNWSPLQSEITPFLFKADTIVTAAISLHLEGNSIPVTVEAVGKLYGELIPGQPYEYTFLEDSFNAHYQSERQSGNIFGLFAGLAVVISCLGLWGLASFTTSQRLKEIGVRKVLGASVSSIVYLLSSQFIKLVLLGAVIGLPLTWFGMYSWLNSFAFRIGLNWDLFVLPLIVLVLIALLTVSLQVLKGATTNPARVLRTE